MWTRTSVALLLMLAFSHVYSAEEIKPYPPKDGPERERVGEKTEVWKLREISDTEMRKDVDVLTEAQRDSLCKRALSEGVDKKMLMRLKASGADCIAALKRNPKFNVSGGEAEAVMKQLKEEKSTDTWTKSDWTLALRQMKGAMKEEDIEKMPKETTRELIKNGDLEVAARRMKKPSEKRAVQKKVKEVYGEADSWSETDLKEMGGILGSIDAETLKKIPKENMKKAAASFRDMEFDDKRKKAAVGKKLVEGMGKDSVKYWSSENLKDVYKYIRRRSAVVGQLSEETIEGSLSDLGSRRTDKSGATQLSRRLKSMSGYSDPKKIDPIKLKNMGHLAKGMGREYLKELPVDSLKGAMETLAKVSFEQGEAREIVKKIKGDPSKFTSSKVKELGQLVKGLEPEDFEKMPDSAVAESLEELREKDFDISQCRAIVKKAKKAGRSNMKKLGRLMSKCISPSDLGDTSLEDLGLECAGREPPELDVDKAQAKEIFKKIRQRFGPPISQNINYTKACIKSWGRVVALGMDPEDMENLPDNGDLDFVFETLAEHEEDMDISQTGALARRLRAHLDIGNKSATSMVGEDRIEMFGVFMKHFENKELEGFPTTAKLAIAKKLGQSSQTKLPQTETERLKDFSLKYVERDGEGVRDRRNSVSLDGKDVGDLGTLFAGISTSDAQRLSKEAIYSNMIEIGEEVREPKVKESVIDNIRRQDSEFLKNVENVMSMASFSSGFPNGLLDSMDKGLLGEVLTDSSDLMVEAEGRLQKRDEAGYTSDFSDEERSVMERKQDAFIQRALVGYMESQKIAYSNRIKRNEPALTCGDMAMLKEKATVLKPEQIDRVAPREFIDCSEFLGSLNSWNNDTLISLARRAKVAYGENVSAWDPEKVRLLGGIVAGLEASEIRELNINSTKIATSIGQSKSLSRDQMEAAASAFLERAQNGAVDQLSESDLMSIGNLACGLTPEQIRSISKEAFRGAMSSIGKLNSCSGDQLKPYASQAKRLFGDVSMWDSAVIASVGSIMGGLSREDISKLNPKQLQAMSATIIRQIPPESIQGVSCDQLSRLTPDRKRAILLKNRLFYSKCFENSSLEVDGQEIHVLPIEVRPNAPQITEIPELVRDDEEKRPEVLPVDVRIIPPQITEVPVVVRDDEKKRPEVLPVDVRIIPRQITEVPVRVRDDEKALISSKPALRVKNIGGIEVDARKESIDMKQLRDISDSNLGTAIQNMSQSDRDDFCQRARKGGADEATLKRLKKSGADCVQAMRRDPTFRPEGSQAEIAMKQMREEKPPTQWDDSEWSVAFRQMPGAVKADDLKLMDANTTKTLIANGDLKTAMRSLKSPSQKRALESQIKSAYGQPENWGKDDLHQLGSLLATMDTDTLSRIPKDNVRAAASSFKDIEFDEPSKKAAAGKKLVEGLGKANQWSAIDIANADQYIRNNPAILNKLSDSAIIASIQDLGARKTDKRGAAQLGKKLKNIPEYSNPAALDSDKIAKMGHLVQGMGRDYLSKLPENAIEGAIASLANVSFPLGEAKELMKKMKGKVKPSNFTRDSIKNLGELVIGLEPEDFEEVPASAIAESIEELSDREFDLSQCRVIIKKAKEAGKSNIRKLGKLMKKCMTPDDVKEADLSDLGLDCTSESPPSFTPDKAQAKEMFNKIKETFGHPSSTNTNYTLSCMKNWGPVAALGMDATDFESLPDNGDLDSVFETLALYEADMDDSQTGAIGKRLKAHLDLDNATASNSIDSSKIERIGKFLKAFYTATLEKFNDTLKSDIARKLGEASYTNKPYSEIVKHKDFALKYVKRDSNNTIEDRRSSQVLDDNDIRELGSLMQGLEEADVRRMDSNSLQNNLGEMGGKIRNLGVQEELWKNMGSISGFVNSSEVIINGAGSSGGMRTDHLALMDKSVMGEALPDAVLKMDDSKSMERLRDSAGFKDEVAEVDDQQKSQKRKEFMQKATQGYLELSNSSKRRRRRNTSPTITCADIQVLGSNADTLSTSQLQSLSNTDFKDCTETLGAITGWSSDQLSTLANKAKSAYSLTPSSWSTSDVRLLGTIAAGLTATEISSLNITSASVLTNMGTSTSFSSSQLKAAFGAFLKQTYSSIAANVTGDDLMTMGNIVCGAETTQINSFTSTSYRTAATVVGRSTACDATQLSAYATLAKAAYGNPSTWDTAKITSVGSVIGGLTKDEVSALTTQQISAISATSMSQIPSTSFVGFSTTQLSGFAASQANSVTATQQQSLSQTQRDALVSAGATVKTANNNKQGGNNSGETIRASLTSVLCITLLFWGI